MKLFIVFVLLTVDSLALDIVPCNLDEPLNQCYSEGQYDSNELLKIWDARIEILEPSEKILQFLDCFLKRLGVYGEDGVVNLVQFASQLPCFLKKALGNQVDVILLGKAVADRCLKLMPVDQTSVRRCFSVRNCAVKYLQTLPTGIGLTL
ncbi:hypothetical protein PPYR_01577 [Photinus pyralis]|uniref:Saposin B-type domain-containing protein n=1 Tax=Photinus pyralis TaxID=7054 RepID=A0A5N4B4R6_PHOPY|nr:hypothetical protein PPYR_01577 [Photinus pyralis]